MSILVVYKYFDDSGWPGCVLGERVAVDYAYRKNIERYEMLIESERDPSRLRTLHDLLAIERQRLAELVRQRKLNSLQAKRT